MSLGPSLWADQAGPARPRPELDGRTSVDVAVVGGGLTGLWTAYHLAAAQPSLEVLVVEAAHVGFGASGRNGGWSSALFPASAAGIARQHGEPAALAMRAAMRGAVDEVGAVCAAEQITCGWTKAGTVAAVRSAPQLARARAEVAQARAWGDEVELLDAARAAELIGASRLQAATFTPDCARVQPTSLVRGLADVVERRGVRVVERTRATALEPGRVRTEQGTVRARHVVRATEAWTATLPGSRRDVVPVYSLMIATEPLPAAVWDAVRLRPGQTFTDHRHLIVYGQRTADDRLAFGGRGAPYHWGSAIHPLYDDEPGVFAALERTLVDLFPVLAGTRITHRWGGPLGIARDWHASVGLDRSTGMAWAGGYVGDGVTTTYLAGRTLAELITGQDSALTRLPWVGHSSPRWEPEPWRWLGVNAGLRAMTAADAEEQLTGRPSRIARVLSPLLGH